MIVPRAKRKRTPFGKVCGCLEGLSLGELGGVVMSSSSIGWIGGGCSSMDVTTFSSPSARNLRLRASIRSWRRRFSSSSSLRAPDLALRTSAPSPSLPSSSSSS